MTGWWARGREDGIAAAEIVATLVILGLLASIAVPLYLDQQKRARDAETKADLTEVAQLVSAHIAETQVVPTITVDGTEVLIDGTRAATLTTGVVWGKITGVSATTWCIDARHPRGDDAKDPGYKYMASDEKVVKGQCT